MTAADTLHVGAERAPFVMLPRWLLHAPVSDGAVRLYCVLHDLVAGREGPTRPVTRGQLAEACAVSIATIDRRLAELVQTRAVEKHAQFETHHGQLANIYWVRLSPPATNLQPPVDNRATPFLTSAVPRAAHLQPPLPQSCGEGGGTIAAPIEEQELEELEPPPPPRQAGGPADQFDPDADVAASDANAPRATGGRRSDGTNLRALGGNPRAAEAAATAVREAERAARVQAALEAKTAARLAAERAGEAGRVAFEAEALALSAALDDDQLAAVVDAVRRDLVGPLARSALPVTRAVVDWCRQAAADHTGSPSLAGAVHAALTAGQPLPDTAPPPLVLPDAPVGTVPLHRRIADLLASPVEVVV